MPGVALLVAGGVLGLAALFTGIGGHVIYEDLTAACIDRVCPAERQSDIDAGTGLVVTSTVLTFAAPIAAAIGVVLLVVDTGPRSNEHVRLTPGPGEIGLGVEARF